MNGGSSSRTPRPTLAYQTVMGGSALYLGALVAYPLFPHGREVWNRQGQVTLRVANPVVVSTRNLDHEVQAEQTRARFTFL